MLSIEIEQSRRNDFAGIVDYLGWIPGDDCVWLERGLSTLVVVTVDHAQSIMKVLGDLLQTEQVYHFSVRRVRMSDLRALAHDEKAHEDLKMFLEREIGLTSRAWFARNDGSTYYLRYPATRGQDQNPFTGDTVFSGSSRSHPLVVIRPGYDVALDNISLIELDWIPRSV